MALSRCFLEAFSALRCETSRVIATPSAQLASLQSRLFSTTTEVTKEVVKPKKEVAQAKVEIGYRPRKLNMIAKQIRGLHAREAMAQLQIHEKKPADAMRRLISQVHGNAVHNIGMDPARVFIAEAYVTKARTAKGIIPHSKGRAGVMRKVTSFFTVRVKEAAPGEKIKRSKRWVEKLSNEEQTAPSQ